MQKYFDLLKEEGADLVKIIDTDSIVTAPWTFYKCKYGCSSFGKRRSCPPNAPNWKETQEIIDSYQTGILFRSPDLSVITPLAVKLARELFLDDYYKALAFGSGPCKKCKTCNIESCNFPKETVPAMEACGIDVFETVRNNGIELHTVRDYSDPQSYFGLVLVE